MDIYTDVTNKEIEVALVGDLNQMWEVISGLEGDDKFMEALEQIKYGVKSKFDIRSIIEGDYEKKVAFGFIQIERKLKIDLREYRDEIDVRKKIIKDILRDLYDDTFDGQEEEDIKGYGNR